MGERADPTLTIEAAARWVTDILAENAKDVPFALVYLRDEEHARLVSAAGLAPGSPAAHSSQQQADDGFWQLATAEITAAALIIEAPDRLDLANAVWPEPITEVAIVPIPAAGETRPAAFLVAGANPRRRIDQSYRSFFELAAGHIGTALATARAYEGERRRANALAELDRAKTAFFANVSHEFRTPLTLMLGPLEEVLAKPVSAANADDRALVDVAHRNGLRMLRLVNSLLDFSRLGAGRSEARFVPTDLSVLTAELASSFRSATEKAGLTLAVECLPLDQPAYVDRDMWEKIVLNLLSNAFKFTLAGGIDVELRQNANAVVLTVRDSGTGIPQSELPRLFERFHRVPGAKGRSFEGSGIGLALVNEMVNLHGGKITVESIVDFGTTFTIVLPLGMSHLPSDRIDLSENNASPIKAQAFVEAAMRWLPDEVTADAQDDGGVKRHSTIPRGRVLLADDNADLRQYIARLLGERGYLVDTVADGQAALDALRQQRPDLIVTDVMMPRLDGFGLIRAVRGDPELQDLPVVMSVSKGS
jgi:signal transduction histidine kinase